MEDGDTEKYHEWDDTRFCILESLKVLYQMYFFAGI